MLEDVINALEGLKDSIIEVSTEERTMLEIYGFPYPPLNRFDLAEMSQQIANNLKLVQEPPTDEQFLKLCDSLVSKTTDTRNIIVPNLYNGNGLHAVNLYTSYIHFVETSLSFLFIWSPIGDNKMLPGHLNRKLRTLKNEVDDVVVDKTGLLKSITVINEAVKVAEDLPIDLASLKEARKNITDTLTQSSAVFGKVDKYYNDTIDLYDRIEYLKEEAEKVVALCEDAYKITTTKGLAGAFDQRASNLYSTMWIWVCGLLISLGGGSWIGTERFNIISEALNKSNPNLQVVWMEFALSIFGLAAPIWFAWIATKQINQRFRLAEDYAFKASVAKTYEGYRREAAKIDTELEKRLFTSTLERFEEAPVRLVTHENYGTPWQELLASEPFKKSYAIFPELKDKLYEVVNPKHYVTQKVAATLVDNKEQKN